MARNQLTTELRVDDQASAEVRKVAEAIAKEAKKVEGADQDVAKSAAEVRRERAKQLTQSQKYSFQLQKIQAGQDKTRVSLVEHRQAMEKAKRELRLLVREGDEIPPQLADEIRKRQALVTQLESEIKARDKTTTEVEQGTKANKRQAITLADIKVKYLFAAAAIRKAVNSTRDFIVGTSQAADDMRKTSERLGVTIEQFQQLDFAMQISGTSMADQRQAFAKLNKITRDAALGMGEASTKMERLGVTTTNADGSLRSTREVLLDVADRFAAMDTGAEKTAASLDLFEESGYKMIQFLSLGRKGIEELSTEADNLGFIIGEKAARNSEEFNSSMFRLKKSLGGASAQLSMSLTPAMIVVIDKMREMFQRSNKASGGMSAMWTTVITTMIDLGKILNNIGTFISMVVRSLAAAFTGFIGKVMQGMGAVGKVVGKFIGKDLAGLSETGDQWVASAKAQAGAMQEMFDNALKFNEDMDDMKEGVFEVATAYKTELEPAAAQTNKTSAKLKGLIAEANEETKKHTGSFKLQKLVTDEMSRKQKADIDEIREKRIAAAREEFETITGLINPALRALTSEAESFGDAMKNAFKAGMGSLHAFAEEAIKKHALSAAAGAASSQSAIPIIGPVMAAAAMSATLSMVMGLLTRMNKGGIVPGPNVNRDVTPALLTPGEIVLPKDLSSELLALVGRRPAPGGAMAMGGMVGAGGPGSIVVNINEQVMTPRTPGELDRFVKDQLIPSLSRLRRKGF